MPEVFVHPTALVEPDVILGPGTRVWDHAHIRRGARIGRDCIIGGKAYLASGVTLADRCKVNSFAYLCTGVTLETGVMVSAAAVFTNDRFPRATTPDLQQLNPSEPTDRTLPTLVRVGASIGANATIGCGLEIGRFAMIGMGAVVTRSVPDFALVVGVPGRVVGAVCRCGHPVPLSDFNPLACPKCARVYHHLAGQLTEVEHVEA